MTAPQNPGSVPTSSDQAVIEVKTSFIFLAFLLYFFKPVVALNGAEQKQNWGTVSIPVPPGRYTVEAWCNYFLAPHMGRNGVVVDVAPDTVTRIHWKAPWLIFLQGSIGVTGVGPVGAAPAPGAVPPMMAGTMLGSPGAPTAPGTPGAPVSPGRPATVGGWLPDPSGRHEVRYHDGQNWTEHVSNAGVTGTDPIGPST